MVERVRLQVGGDSPLRITAASGSTDQLDLLFDGNSAALRKLMSGMYANVPGRGLNLQFSPTVPNGVKIPLPKTLSKPPLVTGLQGNRGDLNGNSLWVSLSPGASPPSSSGSTIWTDTQFIWLGHYTLLGATNIYYLVFENPAGD